MISTTRTPGAATGGLPLNGLLALATAAFITILTEALPAGLLPGISAGLGVPESAAGQLVTVYAVGSLVAAIPLTVLTRGLNRRPLLLTALAGFLIANTTTALSGSYALTLVARFIAGVSAGLLWALAAGYAARLAPAPLKGRAIAIAMAGTPLALSLGVPGGTFLGSLIGWRACFGLISGLCVVLIVWIMAALPDFSGEAAGERKPLKGVLMLPGVRAVLLVVLGFVVAHNLLYTYIAPFLQALNMAEQTDRVLLVFGITSLAGIAVVGALIDHWLRALTLASILLFAVAAVLLAVAAGMPSLVYGAIALWGLAFGGAATLFQTASAKAAGPAADLAQSMLVTVWNTAIAGGGLIGGLLLEAAGVDAFAPALLLLLACAFGVTLASTHGFPRRPSPR
ncbi:MFS transporter [Alloalcanivorax sp. C16-2]|uniref:MFS transporter n=1 Tax=Alloalcanivorax sp. C16-2 TaxID=3390052 RepID=UPI003970F9E9